jgi:DNA-binding NtrC family response regulator
MRAHGAPISKPTILLVEGDASLRRWLAALLAEVGYQVLEAGERQEVLRHLRSHEPVHLVVTDARIGGMPGAEVAQETSNLRPGVPVVRLIGSMAEGLPVCRADLDPSVLLWKPFTFPHFLDVIRAQLSRREETKEVRTPSYTFLR